MRAIDAAELVRERVYDLDRDRVVVAIDGPSAAGTTTLGGVLASMLVSALVLGDDFYRDIDERQRWDLDPAAAVEQYFDWERLRAEALLPLLAGEAAHYRPFSWEPGGGLSERVTTIGPARNIIVEGVYASRPEFADLIDLTVLVQTPEPERHRRMLARAHGNEAWWSRWAAAENLYFTSIRPPESFDLVVPGY
jgi:uridine kinase